MSLRVKLLVTLYAVIGLVWLIHTAWHLRSFERAHIESEVRATKELGAGLHVYLRHLTVKHVDEERLHGELLGFERDVMVIDPDLRVVASSNPARLGRIWDEPGIRAVMRGDTNLVYSDHRHDGRRVIDVSMALEGPESKSRYVLHVARPQDGLEADIMRQRRDHGILLLAAFALMMMLVTVCTHRMILSPMGRIQGRIRTTPWSATAGGRAVQDLHGLERIMEAMLTKLEDDRKALSHVVEEKTALLQQVQDMKGALEQEVNRVRQELIAAEKSLLRGCCSTRAPSIWSFGTSRCGTCSRMCVLGWRARGNSKASPTARSRCRLSRRPFGATRCCSSSPSRTWWPTRAMPRLQTDMS